MHAQFHEFVDDSLLTLLEQVVLVPEVQVKCGAVDARAFGDVLDRYVLVAFFDDERHQDVAELDLRPKAAFCQVSQSCHPSCAPWHGFLQG